MTFSEFIFNIFRFIVNPSVIQKIKDTKVFYLILQFVFLIVMLTASFAHVLHHNVFEPTFYNIFKFIPAEENITIQNGKAVFPEGIKLPHVRSITFGEGSNNLSLYYILDDGTHTDELTNKYNNYALFSPDKAYLKIKEKDGILKYSELDSSFFHTFFGNPITISAENLSNFNAWILSLAILFFIPPFFILPLPTILSVSSLIIMLVLTVALLPFLSTRYKFKEILKFVLFAFTPAVFIQSFACLTVSGALLFIFFLLSYLLQFTYVQYGLKNK